jgi:activating signal cointegrator complex subunit 1
MDVLKPQLIYIGNRCYRKNVVENHTCQELKNYEEDDLNSFKDMDEYEDESCTIDIDDRIQSTPNGFQLSFYVPNAFHKHIIGKGGEMRKRLEYETKTQIKVPRQHEHGDIVITGGSQAGVRSAKTRIDVLMTTARRRMTFTHFLSIPIGNDKIRANFDDFKTQVLQTCKGDRGVDETIFQNSYKLHLTLGVMVLLDDNEVEQARTVLAQCCNELNRLLSVTMPCRI